MPRFEACSCFSTRNAVTSARQIAAYAEAYLGPGAAIQVDAITITPYLGFESMRPIFDIAVACNSSVFVVTRSTNLEGRAIQGSVHSNGRTTEEQLVADIASENRRVAPETIGPIGSVFGPTHGAPTFDIRAMNGLFLAPGVGAQGATPTRRRQMLRNVS